VPDPAAPARRCGRPAHIQEQDILQRGSRQIRVHLHGAFKWYSLLKQSFIFLFESSVGKTSFYTELCQITKYSSIFINF